MYQQQSFVSFNNVLLYGYNTIYRPFPVKTFELFLVCDYFKSSHWEDKEALKYCVLSKALWFHSIIKLVSVRLKEHKFINISKHKSHTYTQRSRTVEAHTLYRATPVGYGLGLLGGKISQHGMEGWLRSQTEKNWLTVQVTNNVSQVTDACDQQETPQTLSVKRSFLARQNNVGGKPCFCLLAGFSLCWGIFPF